jgi:hypothetical protein
MEQPGSSESVAVWPQRSSATAEADPVFDRDPGLAALEQAWRAGLLENEPTV